MLLGISTRTVTRLLTEQTGLGFSRWRMTVRAQHAARLLAHGHGIECAAEVIGYRTVSAFCAAFKERTGKTPGAFRSTLTCPNSGSEPQNCAIARPHRSAYSN
ncbi:helix-turn-helix transcriptional regulator [Citricoccus sp. NR2]|uniref:helix-turn-helix transcriptional regulator n=1 Tax=Citricoccus sp. NR2 TaxID=3004095 RepID=UPI0022DE5A82|nr:helix-turn-helix transcriptional regulator [Citricoccus sp. NR2]WBL20419.1 helix-turn-helix transcriptional regulator [Citricoccus sp. NR2]